MSGITVPTKMFAEVIERFEVMSNEGHDDRKHRVDWKTCPLFVCEADRKFIAELRALLPVADEPECPCCHHKDSVHDGLGCVPGDCDCPFTTATLDAARALIAATIEHMLAARTAERKARVFEAGDDEPTDVTTVREATDMSPYTYRRTEDGWHLLFSGGRLGPQSWSWAVLLSASLHPLTEVLDGGDQS